MNSLSVHTGSLFVCLVMIGLLGCADSQSKDIDPVTQMNSLAKIFPIQPITTLTGDDILKQTAIDKFIGKSIELFPSLFSVASSPQNCWAIQSYPELRSWLQSLGYKRSIDFYSFPCDFWKNGEPGNNILVLAVEDGMIIGFASRGYDAPKISYP